MTPIERLQNASTSLGLKAVEARLENLLEQAAKAEPSYAEFLDQVLSCEVEARRTRYLRARLQLAHLPFVKTFEQFDFGFQPSIDERQVRELRSLRFIHEASNVIMLGPPGVGKTHLSIGLTVKALAAGYSALFTTLAHLAEALESAAYPSLMRQRLRRYTTPSVLVIDEVGYTKLSAAQAHHFFELVTARYEHGSILLTSNMSFSEWGNLLGDEVLATALLDRLLHHAEVMPSNILSTFLH